LIALGQLGAINNCVTGKNSPKISTNEGNNNYMQKSLPIQITGAVNNQGQDFTIVLTDQNMDVTELRKPYITLYLTMDITFDYGFPLSLFTTAPEQPSTLSNKLEDFCELSTGKAHIVLYWYEIPVSRELAKQHYMYFRFKHAIDCIQQCTIQNKYPIQSYLVSVVKPRVGKRTYP
jgi:hypothetical protein